MWRRCHAPVATLLLMLMLTAAAAAAATADATDAATAAAAAADWRFNMLSGKWEEYSSGGGGGGAPDTRWMELDSSPELRPSTDSIFGDLHTSFMNVSCRAEHGLSPVKEMVRLVDDVSTRAGLLRVIAEFHRRRVPCGIDARVVQDEDGAAMIALTVQQPDMTKREFESLTAPQQSKYLEIVQKALKAANTVQKRLKAAKKLDASRDKSDWKSISMKILDLGKRINEHICERERDGESPTTIGSPNVGCPLRVYLDAIGVSPRPKIFISPSDRSFIRTEFGDVENDEEEDVVNKWKHFLMWNLMRSAAPFLTKTMSQLFRDFGQEIAFSSNMYHERFSFVTHLRGQSCQDDIFCKNGFQRRLDAVLESLRPAFLMASPNLRLYPAFRLLHQLQYQAISGPLIDVFSTVQLDRNGHILENLWKLSIAEFTKSLQSKRRGPLKYFVVGFLPDAGKDTEDSLSETRKTCFQGYFDDFLHKKWVKEDAFTEALMDWEKMYKNENVQFAFQVTEESGDIWRRDPTHDFVVISSGIAKWVPQQLTYRDLQRLKSMPEKEKLSLWETRPLRDFKREFLPFHLVHQTVASIWQRYDIPAEVLSSQWRRFGITTQAVHKQLSKFVGSGDADHQQAFEIIDLMIDSNAESSLNVHNNESRDTVIAQGQCSICLEQFSDTAQKPIQTLGCDHTFCTDCIDEWQKEKDDRTCPLCRQPLEIVRIFWVPTPFHSHFGVCLDALP